MVNVVPKHSSAAADNSELMLARSALPTGSRAWLFITLAVYICVLLVTRPNDYVDSFNYAKHIVDHYHRALPAGNDPFWDFGHAAWRPLGYVAWRFFHGPLDRAFAGDEIPAAAVALMLWSLLGGLASTVISYLLLTRISGNAWVGGITAIAFLGTNAVVNYSQTSCAYVAGIACQLAALYLICRSVQTGRLTMARGLMAGLFLGGSICIWFPYVLPMAGLLCFALIWSDDGGRVDYWARARFLGAITGGLVLIVAPTYLAVMASRHIASVDAFRRWVTASRYGISPTRGFARMLFSMPRSFFWLGDESEIWKRFFLRSPGVSWLEVVRAGIWKVAALYLVLGLLVLRLWKSAWGRRLLVVLSAAAVPAVVFAAFLFDPSPPERYLAVFPLLFLAFACVLAKDGPTVFSRFVLPAFFCVMLAVNVIGMWRFKADPASAAARESLQALNQRVTARDCILVPSYRDDTRNFLQTTPFDPASRNRYLFYLAVNAGTESTFKWRQGVAETALRTWQNGGRVWLSRRLFWSKPSPAWWIEGDDTRTRWADVYSFFQQFDTGESTEGPEQFAELTQSEKNLRLLHAAAAAPVVARQERR